MNTKRKFSSSGATDGDHPACQCPELPRRDALMEKIDDNSCATIAPDIRSPAEEAADREWQDFADAVGFLSPATTMASAGPMWEELAQAVQTGSHRSAARESDQKDLFLQELEALHRVISQ